MTYYRIIKCCKLSHQSAQTYWVTELIELFRFPFCISFSLFRTAVINNVTKCVSTFHSHHMLRVNDAEFSWLDKQWEAREI